MDEGVDVNVPHNMIVKVIMTKEKRECMFCYYITMCDDNHGINLLMFVL